MDTRKAAVAALKAGDADQALALLRSLGQASTADDQVLGYTAMAHAIKGQPAEAKAAFRKALQKAPDAAAFLKHGSNFAVYLSRIGATDDLARLAEADWNLKEAAGSASFDVEALKNLCAAMERAGQLAFLADEVAGALSPGEAVWEVERPVLVALCKLERAEDALARIAAPGVAWRDQPECIAIQCFAMAATGRMNRALALLDEYVAKAPSYISKAEETQTATILVIAKRPVAEALLKPLRQQYMIGNFPTQFAQRCSDRYRIATIFAGAGERSVEQALSTGPVLAINNCVNAELLKDSNVFDAVRATEEMTGLRIVNPASRAVHTSRQENAERLKTLAGAVVPRVMRYRLKDEDPEDVAAAILKDFHLPFVLRIVALQQGEGMVLVAERKALVDAISEIAEPHVYAMDYIGLRHANGCFRRMRAAFVNGVPTIMRADYSEDWIVHGRKFEKNQDFYLRLPKLLKDADDIVIRPEKRLGKTAMSALAEIGKMIPLDIFGVDFDVDADGRLVFFEANATMNLLSNAPAHMDYPPSAEREFLAAVDRLLTGHTIH